MPKWSGTARRPAVAMSKIWIGRQVETLELLVRHEALTRRILQRKEAGFLTCTSGQVKALRDCLPSLEQMQRTVSADLARLREHERSVAP